MPLAEGFLLSVALQTSAGSPRRGQTFCQVGIVRGGELANEPAALLISDYLHDTLLLSWPGGLLRSSAEGPGVLRSITGTNPAAGAEISETVPTNARWRFYSLTAQLVASATVANRIVSFAMDDGANVHYRMGQNTAQTAGSTRTWCLSGSPFSNALSGTSLLMVGAPEIYLAAGFRIRTITEGFQAGDDWAAPQFLVEEWIEE